MATQTPIDMALGLLAVIGDLEAAKAKLEEFKGVETRGMEAANQAAIDRAASAEGILARDEAYEVQSRNEIESANLAEAAEKLRKKAERITTALDGREIGVVTRERRVEERETQVEAARNAADQKMSEAQRLIVETQAAKTEYDLLLANLKAALPSG